MFEIESFVWGYVVIDTGLYEFKGVLFFICCVQNSSEIEHKTLICEGNSREKSFLLPGSPLHLLVSEQVSRGGGSGGFLMSA